MVRIFRLTACWVWSQLNFVLIENSPYPFLNLTMRFCKHMTSSNYAADMVANCRWAVQTNGVNIVSGIDLARRVDGQEIFGLTSPLITTSSGAKMGKSASGAIWLNDEKLSSFDFWQFWRNTEDSDVERFLGLFTELPMKEVRRLGALKRRRRQRC